MIFKYGDMFQNLPQYCVLLATGNSYLKRDRTLAMGRGSALGMKENFPDSPRVFGETVMKSCGHLGRYSILWQQRNANLVIGLFQTKYDFKDNSDYSLIVSNISNLNKMIHEWKLDNKWIVRLSFPGIANGGLQYKKDCILDCLKTLPDNVEIWELYKS